MPEQDSAADLFDLKMLPAWATESPNENRYADFAGEDAAGPGQRERGGRGGDRGQRRDRGPRPPRREGPARRDPRDRERRPQAHGAMPPRSREEAAPSAPPPAVDVRFLPDPRALENVLAQIKSNHLAYSVFSLARMFLEKPERYDVRVKALGAPLFQMGEGGPVASDRRVLENGAFARELENFYRTEVTQTEPIKGNFTSVALDRVSGILLGPTNHHAYQQKLRGLYEQRYSRRMSFPDFQRQIAIVNDPEVVERWKEEARSLTTYTTVKEEPPQTFTSSGETERHFRQNYLGHLLRESGELTLDGVVSRQLPDHALGRVIEHAWVQETRSPAKMMQELIAAFPEAGLHIFRHRKGMLFVAPVRPRPFSHQSVSPSIATLLKVLAETPGINRKQLLEKMLPVTETGSAADEAEKRKLTLASDLRWLISEGHVIEFNDGALDVSRAKAPSSPPKGKAEPAAKPEAPNEQPVAPTAAPVAETSVAETAVVESQPSDATPAESAPVDSPNESEGAPEAPPLA